MLEIALSNCASLGCELICKKTKKKTGVIYFFSQKKLTLRTVDKFKKRFCDRKQKTKQILTKFIC